MRKHKQTTTKVITKQNFAHLFKDAYTAAIKPNIVRYGFEKCGLYPLNADNVDFNKCIDTRRKKLDAEHTSILNDSGNDDKRSTITVIEYEIGEMLTSEFCNSFSQKIIHPHPYFSLWVKCKCIIEKTDHYINFPAGEFQNQEGLRGRALLS